MAKYWSNKPYSPPQVSKTKGPNPIFEWLKGEPHFNKTRFRLSVLFIAILFLFTFIRIGFAPLPVSTDTYYYADLGLPVFEFTRPVQGIASMFSVIGDIGSGILGTISINSSPSELYCITYHSTNDDNILYVLLYGSMEKDFTQFSKWPLVQGVAYFRIYAIGYTEYNALELPITVYNIRYNRLVANTDCLGFVMATPEMNGYNVFVRNMNNTVVGGPQKLNNYYVEDISKVVNFNYPNLTYME